MKPISKVKSVVRDRYTDQHGRVGSMMEFSRVIESGSVVIFHRIKIGIQSA